MTYLLSVAIGPVQDFIAAARKCRDLWYGSRLLSDVSKAAAQSLQNDGATLIFPVRVDATVTVSNKLLARVETENISGVAKRAEDAARQWLASAADILPVKDIDVNTKRFNRQLETILEVYTVWTPLNDYPKCRERLDLLAAGRKALRNFRPYRGDEGVPKSSLDGIRENVIEANGGNVRVRENECLDAIGMVKRFGGDYQKFDSTLEVAAAPYVRSRKQYRPGPMQEYAHFLKDVGEEPETYSMLYRHESRQAANLKENDVKRLNAIREKLGSAPKPPYYGFLLGDGDQMGRAITAIDSESGHREFSSSLSKFADQARGLTDEAGCAIYCGGDDVMALLPLDHALECAAEVNKKFRETAKGVTFSAGLVVAHALEPLSEVREWAKQAERAAKDPKRGDRNALCVSVYPRSGAPIELYGKWDAIPDLLRRIIKLYLEKKLSLGLAHEFRDLLHRTRGWDVLNDVIIPMAKAIAAKKKEDEGAAALLEPLTGRSDLEQLSNSMLVARPFARAKKEAAWTGGDE